MDLIGRDYKQRKIVDYNKELTLEEKEKGYKRLKEFEKSHKADTELIKEKEHMGTARAFVGSAWMNEELIPGQLTDKAIEDEIAKAQRDVFEGRELSNSQKSKRRKEFLGKWEKQQKIRKEMDLWAYRRESAYEDAGILAWSRDNHGRFIAPDDVAAEIQRDYIPLVVKREGEKDKALEKLPEYGDDIDTAYNGFLNEHLSHEMTSLLKYINAVDMEQFSYKDDESFLDDFAGKYEKLRAIAKSGPKAIEYLERSDSLQATKSLHPALVKAKVDMAKEIMEDYESRMRIMSSPYYTLLAGKDFDGMKEKDIKRLKDKNQGNPALMDYLDQIAKRLSVDENGKKKVKSFKGKNITKLSASFIKKREKEDADRVRKLAKPLSEAKQKGVNITDPEEVKKVLDQDVDHTIDEMTGEEILKITPMATVLVSGMKPEEILPVEQWLAKEVKDNPSPELTDLFNRLVALRRAEAKTDRKMFISAQLSSTVDTENSLFSKQEKADFERMTETAFNVTSSYQGKVYDFLTKGWPNILSEILAVSLSKGKYFSKKTEADLKMLEDRWKKMEEEGKKSEPSPDEDKKKVMRPPHTVTISGKEVKFYGVCGLEGLNEKTFDKLPPEFEGELFALNEKAKGLYGLNKAISQGNKHGLPYDGMVGFEVQTKYIMQSRAFMEEVRAFSDKYKLGLNPHK